MLTKEILCAYAPYEIRMKGLNCEYPLEGVHIDEWFNWGEMTNDKLLLRPLSSLTKPITHNGETFVPMERILKHLKIEFMSLKVAGDCTVDLVLNPKKHKANTRTKENRNVRFWLNIFQGIGFYCTDMRLFMYKDIYGAIQLLLQWNFDIFGLLESGNAINLEKQ